MSATGVEREAFRVGTVIGRSFSVLARNIAPVGLLALAMLSLPYVLGYLLGIRYSGGPFVDLATAAWSWREALALTLQYFLATCLGAALALGVYETLQGRRPGARALIRRGLVRLPRVLAVVVVVTVPQALLAVVVAVRVEEPWPMPWLSTLGPSAFLLLVAGAVFTFLACFVYGFAKSVRENLRRDELETFRQLADAYLALDRAGLAAAQAVGAIVEVKCNDQAVQE